MSETKSETKNEKKGDKIYVGNAKIRKGTYGDIVKYLLSAEDVAKIVKRSSENDGWCAIDICERKQPSDKGYTHYGMIDTWKPERKGDKGNTNPVDDDNLPF